LGLYRLCSSSYDYFISKVLLSKNIIAYFSQSCGLVIINTYKDKPIVTQQVSRHPKSRIHHIQPIRMKPPAGISITTDLCSTFHLASQLHIVLDAVLKVIRVNKIPASVIRRIDINQVHLPCIALLQQFKNFKVVPLDHQVLSRIPVNTLLRAGAQCSCRRRKRKLSGTTFTKPV